MPESVTDRPTTSHEYLFLLTKSERYFYDADAIREPIADSVLCDNRLYDSDYECGRPQRGYPGDPDRPSRGAGLLKPNPNGRNKRSVWTIPTSPYKGAHFATFPPALVEPCIKAGTSERGVCPECGMQWERVTERTFRPMTDRSPEKLARASGQKGIDNSRRDHDTPRGYTDSITTGWRPTCACYDGLYFIEFPKARRARKRYQRYASGDWWRRARKRPGPGHWPVQPAIVLDPFVGSGTTNLVARELGRRSVGLDLSFDYLRDQARPRLELDKLAAWENGKQVEANWEELPLFRM